MNPAFVFRRVLAAESNISSLTNMVGSISTGSVDTSGLARSADVSSAFLTFSTSLSNSTAHATFATSAAAFAAYQVKGSYANSSDVSSFYSLKSSVAGFANSSDVSSFYALKSGLPNILGTANSSDVSSFYALKTSLPSVAAFANSSDVSSSYARFMGGMDVWSLAAPASRTIANSIAWCFCVTSTTITSAFLVMPQSPFDGQETGFNTIGAITFMTHTVAVGSTQVLYNKLAAAAAGLAAQWKWNASSKAWFRIR